MPVVQVGGRITLPNGRRSTPVGWFNQLAGFFSPVSRHILCGQHAERVQPLQPAMGDDVKNYPWCPYCKGGALHGRYSTHRTRSRTLRALRDLGRKDAMKVPRHHLYEEGEFETGCFTHQGNELALVCMHTRHLHDTRMRVFEKAFRSIRTVQGALLLETGLPSYDIRKNCGPHVPTLVHSYFVDHVNGLYKATLKERCSLVEDPFDTDEETRPDFTLWIIRDFERWLNDTHSRRPS